MAASYQYVALLDIPKEYEDRFNELYEKEHIRDLKELPGVGEVRRYKVEYEDTPGQYASYWAVYDLEDPNLPQTDAWKEASNRGVWKDEIRPLLTVRHHVMLKKIY